MRGNSPPPRDHCRSGTPSKRTSPTPSRTASFDTSVAEAALRERGRAGRSANVAEAALRERRRAGRSAKMEMEDDEFELCTVHVRGMGGDLEDEVKLGALFERFGQVRSCVVRPRLAADGTNTSWALVTFARADAAANAVETVVRTPDDRTLQVNKYSHQTATQSTGGMVGVLEKAKKVETAKEREDKALRKLFADIDIDGSGTLDKAEVKLMAKRMGEKLKGAQLDKAFDEMTLFRKSESEELEVKRRERAKREKKLRRVAEGDGIDSGDDSDEDEKEEVSFDQFRKWWHHKGEMERKEARRKARELFDAIDRDKGGTVDADEFNHLTKMLQKHFPRIKLYPEFDLKEDFRDMCGVPVGEDFGPEDLRAATFSQFESWWKRRSGDDNANIPVLPEAMARRINDSVETGSRLPAMAQTSKQRTGKALWEFLRPRVLRLVEIEKRWGGYHEVYPSMSKSSTVDDTVVPRNVRDPDSKFSVNWDMMQVLVLLYISFTFPYNFAFGIERRPADFMFWVEVCIDLYFYCDLYLCFHTAYYTSAGVLEINLSRIRSTYLRGWFCIDGEEPSGRSDIKILKILRLMRMTKLLRIARLKKLLDKYEDLFDLNQYLGMVATLFVICSAAHYMACAWYVVGLGEEEHYGEFQPVKGWVRNKDAAGWSNYDLAEGCETEAGCVIPYSRRYWLSMYSALGLTWEVKLVSENIFSLISILMSGFIYGALAGVISTLMMGMAAGDQDYAMRVQKLKAWMHARHLKKQDRTKILAYYKAVKKGANSFDEAEILKDLPPNLGGSVTKSLYGGILEEIPIFRSLGVECVTSLCHACVPFSALRGQFIMEEQKVGTELYILTDGEVQVSQDDEKLGYLGPGSFFGEYPVLQALSELGGNLGTVRTRTVRATRNCDLAYLDAARVLEVVEQFPELKIRFKSLQNKRPKRKVREATQQFRAVGTQTPASGLIAALQRRLEALYDTKLLEDDELCALEDKVADAIVAADTNDGDDSASECVMQMAKLSEGIASDKTFSRQLRRKFLV